MAVIRAPQCQLYIGWTWPTWVLALVVFAFGCLTGGLVVRVAMAMKDE